MLSEYEDGPIKIYHKFTVAEDPKHQMSSEVEAIPPFAVSNYAHRKNVHNEFFKTFFHSSTYKFPET